MNKREIGSEYEKIAITYLEKNGITILEKNFRNRSGEIDIIGLDNPYLVFFEVKYRKNTKFGSPLEAVNYKKQLQIQKVASYYLYINNYSDNAPVRFDCIGILGSDIDWIKNAF